METVLATLKAAAEPTRLRLLVLCARGELNVTELTRVLGQSQPRVSRHLKTLCDAGLLSRHREGTNAFFRVADEGAAAALARVLVDAIPSDDPVALLDLSRLDAIKRARADAAAAYFRENASRWDQLRSMRVPEREVEAAILEILPDSGLGDLLDIGTGTGRILELLRSRLSRGFGVDQSREMLALARSRLEAAGARECQVRQGDMYALPFPDASFDTAVVHQVLHYAENPDRVIAEAARCLRAGGRILIVDFAPHDLESLTREHAHLRSGFAEAEVWEMCRKAGLRPERALRLPGEPLTVTLWTATLGDGNDNTGVSS